MSMSSLTRRFVIVAGLLTVSAGSAYAQHSHAHAAPNGGQIQAIGKYEGELVVRGAQATLYVVDEAEKKVDASTLSASAIILAKGNQQKTVELKPAGENKLAGSVDFPVEGKFRATITLRNASGEIGKARYSLDAK